MRRIPIIAWKEFSDHLRSGWVVICMLVWLGAIILTSYFGLAQIGHIGFQGYERTAISLVNLVQYLAPLLALLIGHDLIVSEREERTLSLVLASGVSRRQWLAGKFLGGCLTVALPLLAGYASAGALVGFSTQDAGLKPFLILAGTGLVLGIIFVAIGLLISIFCRSRVQSLVSALLAWCVFIFVFDLAALGMMISAKAPAAAQEIEFVCDTTHVNEGADLHQAFDKTEASIATPRPRGAPERFTWIYLNPVDLFRAINLSDQLGIRTPALAGSVSAALWLLVCLGASYWQFRKIDL